MNTFAVEDDFLTVQLADIEIKSRAPGQFGNLLTKEKYPKIRKFATLTALFVSTYLCQSAFSKMKISKSKYHSTITDGHLEACLRLATSSYWRDYATLAESIQCKSSEYTQYI